MKKIIILLLLFLVACATIDTEENETTEEEEEEAIVEKESTKGDLIAKTYSDTAYPDLNQEMELRAAVLNLGVERIKKDFTYRIQLWKGANLLNQSQGVFTEELIPATEKVIYTFNYTFDELGEYDFKVELDYDNKITELKENNNNKTFTIYLREEEEEEEESSGSTSSDCEDTDEGQVYDEVGTCTDSSSFTEGRDDFCRGDESLAELYCENNRCNIEIVECENVCMEGKCI